MFLSPDELRTLTGYKRPAEQAKWLSQEGIRHRVNGANRVVVLRCDLESSKPKPRHPNLAAVRA
jgi:hypothetical protein